MRVGLIGHGYWGKILESKLSKYFTIEFIADSKYDYFDELSGIDWVFIATPYETHYGIVKECIDYGINVFCEKPFNLDVMKSTELFNLAEKRNVKLYIDNIFLDRKEVIFAKNNIDSIDSIKFKWYKPSTPNCGLVDGLLYHDIYLMMYLLDNHNGDVVVNSHEQSENCMNIDFEYDGIDIIIEYNSNNKGKNKTITINDNITIDLNNPINDPLDEIIKKICNGGVISYDYNRLLTINTEKIIKKLIDKYEES